MMVELQEKITLVLAGWNPVGVAGHVALAEYEKYSVQVFRALETGTVKAVLLNALSEMGFDPKMFENRMSIELDNLVELFEWFYENEKRQ